MPLEKMWVRSVDCPHWRYRTTVLIDERTYAIDVVDLAGDQDFKLVGKAYQATVEHPVRCTRKRYTVLNGIGTVEFHWSNVSGIDLSSSAAVDELEARESTAFAIGPKHNSPKCAIAHRPTYEALDSLTICLKLVGGLVFGKFLWPHVQF